MGKGTKMFLSPHDEHPEGIATDHEGGADERWGKERVILIVQNDGFLRFNDFVEYLRQERQLFLYRSLFRFGAYDLRVKTVFLPIIEQQ